MSAYSDRVVADGAVAYWRLNEASGLVAHDSVGTNNGTISGGVTLNQGGALPGDAAMAFDGVDGKIQVPSGPYITGIGTGPFTIELWLKEPAVLPGQAMFLYYSGAFTYFREPGNATYTDLTCVVGSFPVTVVYVPPDNTWRHVVLVATRSPDQVTPYVNGVAQAPTTGSGLPDFSSATGPMNFGSTGFGSYTNATLDDIAIYHTALTPAQIATHYALRLGYDPYATRVISDGALAYWRLDEASGLVAHDLVAGNNGTISGGVTLGQPGAVPGDASMVFNGVNGAIVAANGPPIGLGSFTLECWVRRAIPHVGQEQIFTCYNTVGNTNLAFLLYRNSSDPNTYGLIYQPGGGVAIIVSGVADSDSAWHHIVVVFARGNPDRLTFYLDGVQTVTSTSGTTTGVDYTLTGNITLGGNPGAFYGGSLDDIATYLTALTPAQIATHYALRQTYDPYATKVISDGALAYWRLDERSGLVAKDIVGGNNGTISGGVTLGQPGAISGDTAMRFDGIGGTLINIAGSLGTALPTVTIEGWMRPPLGVTYPSGARLWFSSNTNTIYVGLNGSGGAIPYCNITLGGTGQNVFGTSIPLGVWVYHVITWDGTTIRVYQNGVLAGSGGPFSGTVSIGSARIGDYGGGSFPWWGDLDEIAIYPTALTPAQILAHYKAAQARPNLLLTEGEMESRTPYNYMLPVTPDQDFEHKTSGLYIGAGGDVSIVQANGKTVVFTAAVAGSLLSVQATRVNSAGTTAANLVALFYV